MRARGIDEATLWTLHLGARTAVCRMVRHAHGYELRLELAGEVFLSEVCGDDASAERCQEGWRAGLEEKGWVGSLIPDR